MRLTTIIERRRQTVAPQATAPLASAGGVFCCLGMGAYHRLVDWEH